MKLLFAMLSILSLLFQNVVYSNTYVIDGDTIEIDGTRIRLYGIDAPETKQAHGRESTEFMKNFIKNKHVSYVSITVDRYGRTVALVLVNGESLQEELLGKGIAWYYPKYCKKEFCKKWEKLQKEAQSKKLGLWENKNAVSPWKWRHKY